jgi:hypothetical protein
MKKKKSDFNKIKEYILKVMKRNCFNETNILILDAEPTKIMKIQWIILLLLTYLMKKIL